MPKCALGASILVLSDTDAAFGLPMDERRQTLVWIDDFTIDEAAQFLDNVGCLPLHRRIDSNGTDLNEQLRRRLFAFVGTRPSTLESIATMLADVPPASLDEFIVAELAQADDVASLVCAERVTERCRVSALGRDAAAVARAQAAQWRSGGARRRHQGAEAVPRASLSPPEPHVSLLLADVRSCGTKSD